MARDIALVYNEESPTDRAFGQQAQQALDAIADKKGYTIETHMVEDFQPAIKELLDEGIGIVVTVGPEAGEAVEQLAGQYGMSSFITINSMPDPDLYNVVGVVPEDDADDLREKLASQIEMYYAEDRNVWQSLRLRLTRWDWRGIITPSLAILTALLIGGIVVALFSPEVWTASQEQGLGAAAGEALRVMGRAYSSLFEGAFGDPVRAVNGFFEYLRTGDDTEFVRGVRPLLESLQISTPYIFTGLAVALAFRAGLFNIGAEGQYFVGGLLTTFVGYSLTGLPAVIHLPLALIAGFMGGAIWAAISGFLKARTGAHEVITTIMLNYIAFRLADFLLQVGGPMARPGENRPVSPAILQSAWLPQFFPNNSAVRINFGLFLAFAMVFAVGYLLFRTTIGFEFRTVGANPRAARTAGISVERNFVLSMFLSGGLAGLAGSHDILGVTRFMPNAFQAGYGFDAIAIALLGRNHPVGVLLASLLFGFLRSGARRMQAADIPIDIIVVVQGLIIIFIAAPELIRLIYRLRVSQDTTEETFTRGWGGSV